MAFIPDDRQEWIKDRVRTWTSVNEVSRVEGVKKVLRDNALRVKMAEEELAQAKELQSRFRDVAAELKIVGWTVADTSHD